MKKRLSYFGFAVLLWIFIASASTGVEAQSSTEGFISIDCGTAGNHSYVDGITGIPYTSDDRFTDAGINYKISEVYSRPSLAYQQLLTLRSFPDGARNCYSLKPLVRGQKYLVRAAFLYGNYDGEDNASAGKPLQFDLHLGVDLWRRVNVSGPSNLTMAEALFMAAAEFAWVCPGEHWRWRSVHFVAGVEAAQGVAVLQRHRRAAAGSLRAAQSGRSRLSQVS